MSHDLVYNLSKWQKYIYDSELKNNDTLRDTEATGDRRVSPAWPGFQAEVMARLYSGGDVPPLDKPLDGTEWAQRLHGEVAEMGEFKRLARRCRNDPWAAGMATSAVLSSVLDALPRDLPRQDQDPREAQSLVDQGEEDDNVDALIAGELMQQDAVESGDALTAVMDLDRVRRKVRAACAVAEESIATADALCSGYGFDPASTDTKVSGSSVKAALARRIAGSAKLRELAELAGRLRRMALAMLRAKPQHGAGEISDIEQGDALARVLPSEKLLAADEMGELLFLRRLREQQLLQYQLTERPKEALGPMVICVDHSSSMAGPPEIWSKAVLIGLAAVAEKQRRVYAVVDFNSRVVQISVFTKPDPQRLMDHVERFYRGGTDFGPPLTAAFELLCEAPAFKKADVVFISDGECAVPRQQAKACSSRGARILGVGIGSLAAASLDRFCDATISVDDIRGSMGNKNAGRVFDAVIGG